MGKTVFEDGDPGTGTLGTIVTAEFLNALNNHRHTGRDIDGEGALDYAVATGSANAYAIELTSTLDEYIEGMPIVFQANHDNTGAATLDVNELGAVAIKKNGGSALEAGDIVSGQVVTVVHDGTYFQMQSPPAVPVHGALIGDGTAGRVVRQMMVVIANGTNASTIKVSTSLDELWNGNAISEEDNLGKGGDTGNFALDINGQRLSIEGGFTGDPVAALAVIMADNNTGTAITCNARVFGGALRLYFNNAATGAFVDLTSLLDSGSPLHIDLTYVTSE